MRYFTQALTISKRIEKLHYNLGITYYKLNNYEKALSELALAIEDPQLASAAFFNSGFIYTKLGQLDSAKYQYQLAYNSAITEKQKLLAMHGLKSMAKLPPQSRQKIWTARAEINIGIDDNVTRTQRPGLGVGQNYRNVAGSALDEPNITDKYLITNVVANVNLYKQINLGGYLYAQNYQEQVRYNVRQQNIHLDVRSNEGGNLYLIATDLESIQVGDKSYLNSWGVRLQGTFRVTRFAIFSSQFYVKDFTAKDNSSYRYLQGKLNHFQSKLSYRINRFVQIGLDYRFEVNDRDDIKNTDGSTRISYSPISNRYGIDLKLNITTSLWLQFDRYNRIDTYSEALEQVEIDPCIPNTDPNRPCLLENIIFQRTDYRKVFISDLVWRVNSRWMVKLSYQIIKHNSNKAIQAYENNILYLGAVVEF
ncbi:MAG: tetratricopeptide repeat protein [Thiohalomonadales bacterium]